MADHRAEDPPPPPRKSQRGSEPAADVTAAEAPPVIRRRRRVTTPSPEGSDPTPISEAPRHRAPENDQRLRADKPPHWG